MLGSLHDTSTMPLAVATEVPGWVSTELGDGMSERMNQNRSGMHLARLKQCLLLYVNAKFMDGVSFTANAFRSPEIYVPRTKSSGALWASCAAVVLRAHAHKRSRSNGAGMLHAVMCPSRTANTVVVAKETRAFPTMFF